MPDWTRLEPGMTVTVRGKRQLFDAEVTVAEVLPRNLDGYGFVSTDGREFRRFFYDLSSGPMRGLSDRSRGQDFEVTRVTQTARTVRVRAKSAEDAVAKVKNGTQGRPVHVRRSEVSIDARPVE